MGQTYQPGMWQEIEGTPAETSDAEILAAVRRVIRDESAVRAADDRAALRRLRQWQPAPKQQNKLQPDASAQADRALLSQLLDRLLG